MKYNPITYQLKSGQNVIVRIPEISEALDLIHLKRSYIMGTTTIPMTEEEYVVDVDSESQLISEYHESKNGILLVAELSGKLIGNIDLTGSRRSKMFHTAMIGMGIQEEWRNQGLGSILMESVLTWAREQSELQLIWLDVYASNDLGLGLYKKFGFQVSGEIKKFFKERDTYIDKVQMYLHI